LSLLFYLSCIFDDDESTLSKKYVGVYIWSSFYNELSMLFEWLKSTLSISFYLNLGKLILAFISDISSTLESGS
jgi:hypothetical protein